MSGVRKLFAAPPPPTPMIIPPAPAAQAPVMPDPGSAVAMEDARTRMAQRRRGRQSTILGGADDSASGAQTYTRKTLGG